MICWIEENTGFIVASLAFMVALAAIRHQIITQILSQLYEKAKECNGYLNSELQIDNNLITVSGILSAIITAKQILKLHKRRYLVWLLFYRKQFLVDNFHLQLHTSIRVWIREIQYSDLLFENVEIEDQLKKSKSFLKKSIEKYDRD